MGEDVLGDVRVDRTEWIVEEVNVAVLVQTPCQTHPLLLTSAQVYALHHVTTNDGKNRKNRFMLN